MTNAKLRPHAVINVKKRDADPIITICLLPAFKKALLEREIIASQFKTNKSTPLQLQ